MGQTMSLVILAIVLGYWLIHLIQNWYAMRKNYRISATAVMMVKYLAFGCITLIPEGSLASLACLVGGALASIMSYGILWGDGHPLHTGHRLKYLVPIFESKTFKESERAQYWLLVGIDVAVLALIVLPAWLLGTTE